VSSEVVGVGTTAVALGMFPLPPAADPGRVSTAVGTLANGVGMLKVLVSGGGATAVVATGGLTTTDHDGTFPWLLSGFPV